MKDDLDKLTDDALQVVIQSAEAILARRKHERRKAAIAQMRTLAAEHGLVVEFAEQKKRGRPAKGQDGTS